MNNILHGDLGPVKKLTRRCLKLINADQKKSHLLHVGFGQLSTVVNVISKFAEEVY
jgi:hypothetical protein